MVIADEIYEQLTYDIDHVAIASLPSMFTRTVTINGFSKSHSMTGYRIGYSASVTLVAKAISKLQSQTTSSASSISQYAALRALQVDDAWIQSRRVELQQKRDLAYSMLMSIPNVSCPKPNGAFYLLPDVSAYYGLKTKSGVMVNNSHELCLQLLKDESVRNEALMNVS
jgi:aspartate/methionine/tyrosine aminotransferase